MFLPYQEYKEILPIVISDFLENQITLNELEQKFNYLFLEVIPTECFSVNEFNLYSGLSKLLASSTASGNEVLNYLKNTGDIMSQEFRY